MPAQHHTLKLTTDEVEAITELLDGNTERWTEHHNRARIKLALIREEPLDPTVLEHYRINHNTGETS